MKQLLWKKLVLSLALALLAILPACAEAAYDGTIAFSEGGAALEGAGLSLEGNTVVISAAGSYLVTGECQDGRIVIEAKGKDVRLTLENVSLTSQSSAAIFAAKAESLEIVLPDGTSSILSDGESYAYNDQWSSQADEEPNACLYSKADLVITGGGALTVAGNMQNGLTGKDSLEISGATLAVTAKNHGVTGKDSLALTDAALDVTAGGDALRTNNQEDASLGWISVSGGALNLDAGEDAIQADTGLTVTDAAISAKAGAKGLKSEGSLTVNSGEILLDSADDCLHAGGDILIGGGTLTLSTQDDGVHADGNLSVTGGVIDVSESYEGLEAIVIDISGGEIRINASDDGLNAAGGNDQSGFGGMGGRWDMEADSSASISVAGGYIVIDADGDGVDSNGSVTMTGGTLIVYGPTNNGNGALDFGTSFDFQGGTLLAAGASGMAAVPASDSACILSIGQSVAAGDLVQIVSGDREYVFEIKKAASSVIFASDELAAGAACAVSVGGSYSGSFADGAGQGGAYTGGTEVGSVTLSTGVNAVGSATGGFGGNMGGFGGGRGGFGGGQTPPEGFDGQTPPDGFQGRTPPEGFDGQTPPDISSSATAPSGDAPRQSDTQMS